MCGICGIAGRDESGALDRMIRALDHRGPDDRGRHVDRAAQVALGHTRLSIVELSDAGHQPMHSPDGQVTIVYNGEIYNHMDLRAELASHHAFRGRSDTETILCAYLSWGKACLARLNGMFAFAIWDRRSEELWLVRDRLGIKPLYYSVRNGELRFASEVRALLADPEWPREIDLDAVDAFLRLRYVPHPRTLVSGISSLAPGCTLTWKRGDIRASSYWSPPWQTQASLSASAAEERFTQLLADSTRMNLMSDVPLGVFLSGGLDSTLVTALARQHHDGPLHTFSVAFEGDDEDARIAAGTARTLGCEHSVVHCNAADLDRLPEVAGAIDQPVGDAVILPMFFLNRAARGKVKTVLTGEGADELLMGYAHQAQLLQLARLSGVLGLPGMAATLKFATRILPVRFWDFFFSYGNAIGSAGVERLLLLMRDIRSAARRYLNYTSLFEETERVRLYGSPLASRARREVPAGFGVARLEDRGQSLRRGLMQIELDTWLPDNILTKQDNLGMAHGLEGRVPYLDHRLVEEVVGWNEPTFRAAARDKGVLRRELARRWPDLPRRKKRAFRLDFHPAFRSTLLRLTEDHVLPSDSVMSGLVRTARVRQLAAELDESPFLRGKQLAALIVLEAWLRQNVKSPLPVAVVPPDAVPLSVSH